jgi:sensor histidine kinase YesM
MIPQSSLPPRVVALALVTLALSVAFLSAVQLYVNWTGHGVMVPLGMIFTHEAVEWLMWAAAVPVLISVDARASRGGGAAGIAAHLALFLAAFGVNNAVMTALKPLIETDVPPGPFVHELLTRASVKLPAAVFVYGLILLAVRWLSTAREYHSESLRRARLENELAEARLQNLRMQIHPHFLFNTFNSVSALVREGESQAATATLAHLGELLRHSVSIEEREIPLRDELDLLEHYLAIQRIRFSDRLDVRVDASPEAMDALVPPLLLQPLVENAVKHGIDPVREDGRVRVEAAVDAGTLRIAVTDNGRGPEPDGTDGIGLTNTRRRLAEVYGDDTWFALQPAEGGGAVAELRIPYRRNRGD